MAEANDEAPNEKARRASPTWTTKMKAAFLDHLAATCNVKASAGAIDVDPSSVYGLRRKDKKFRAQWADAVECGYEMLETQLIGHALDGGGPALINGDVAATGPIDVRLALALLTSHRGRRDGSRDKDGPKYKTVSAEQTNASILRKLGAMKRARAQRS